MIKGVLSIMFAAVLSIAVALSAQLRLAQTDARVAVAQMADARRTADAARSAAVNAVAQMIALTAENAMLMEENARLKQHVAALKGATCQEPEGTTPRVALQISLKKTVDGIRSRHTRLPASPSGCTVADAGTVR